jgi:hypothetical protein
MINDAGYSNYSTYVWQMILKFHEFWSTHKPTLLESEIHLFSDEYKFAGTCDLVVEIKGEKWLLDIKTSNSLHTSHELQLAAYAQAWNELYEEKIDRVGIIWLKSTKHKEDKKGIKINCQITLSDLVDDVSKLHAREIKTIFRNKVQTSLAQFIASGKKSRNLTIKVLDKSVVIA